MLKTLAAFLLVASLAADARLKDLANIEGVRENQLIGYSLAAGRPPADRLLEPKPHQHPGAHGDYRFAYGHPREEHRGGHGDRKRCRRSRSRGRTSMPPLQP